MPLSKFRPRKFQPSKFRRDPPLFNYHGLIATEQPQHTRAHMTHTRFSFSALQPFGVQAKSSVSNLSDASVQAADIDAIKAALARHGVVVFREQWLDDAQFIAFLRRLGKLTFTIGETPVADHPDLNLVSNVGRTTPPKSVFHTDTSYVSRPPAYTALRAVKIPAVGGETLFSDQYLAYDTLPSTVKEKLAIAKTLHIATGVILDATEERQTWHALFQSHPISGKLALYLSTPARCQAISGLSDDTAKRAIKLLYRHSIRPSRLYRHAWQAGDIVIWDNRCTMHRADHAQVVTDRVLHRGLVLPHH
jgi:taurine dioxygenase